MIKVLNAGYVELLDWMGGDKAIIEAARVCFQTEGSEKSDKMLIESLIRKKHASPLEHCTMRFKVKLPLFVRDQWVRHRIGMSYNIKSLRYCEANPEFFIPSEFEAATLEYIVWTERLQAIFDIYLTWIEYFKAKKLKSGRARELARIYLPTGIYTEMIVTMNAASLIHFLDLRDDKHAQPEIQAYAKALLECAKTIAPITFGSYEELKKVHFSNVISNEQSIDKYLSANFGSIPKKDLGYEQLILF